MITADSAAARPSFAERLRNAGVRPDDTEELRLNKSLLAFATGLVCALSMAGVALYSVLGPEMPVNTPFLFQLLLVGNLLLYVRTGNFDFFRVTQLALFLFAPFVVQWSMGNFITSSGIILWGLLAPIGAILFFGVRESVAWFFAWVFLTALSGLFDYLLADPAVKQQFAVPTRTIVVFFALNFIAVATIIYALLRFSIQQRNKARAKIDETLTLLQVEQERSERLLLNILPGPVAERLKHSEQTIADGFADVTVMFADIVNFTQVAGTMSPTQVFTMLNRIFSAFDELAEKFGLEKIKTIGDAYMIAGGLNVLEQHDYTAAIADMAIAMRDLLRNDFTVNSSQLEIRVGIGTGPVVAGVVGKKKFIYDLWGDTVNIASRLTSEGAPGMIQCDALTWKRLHEHFDFHAPQTVYLKGKGDMTVYRLTGRKTGTPAMLDVTPPGPV